MCHNNKDGSVQRILGNSYGQPIISDMWNSSAPYRFCNKNHKHPEYGKVLIGDSNGKMCKYKNRFHNNCSVSKKGNSPLQLTRDRNCFVWNL